MFEQMRKVPLGYFTVTIWQIFDMCRNEDVAG